MTNMFSMLQVSASNNGNQDTAGMVEDDSMALTTKMAIGVVVLAAVGVAAYFTYRKFYQKPEGSGCQKPEGSGCQKPKDDYKR